MRKKGFTLIELIASIAIFSILLCALYPTFLDILKNQDKYTHKLNIKDDAKYTKSIINNDFMKTDMNSINEPVLDSGKWVFVGDDDSGIPTINQYIKDYNYRPLIYLEQIDGNKCCYLFKKDRGELHKITANGSIIKGYFPKSFVLNNSSCGNITKSYNNWDYISGGKVTNIKSTYDSTKFHIKDSDVNITNLRITDVVRGWFGIPIKTYNYKNFSLVGAYSKYINGALFNYALLKINDEHPYSKEYVIVRLNYSENKTFTIENDKVITSLLKKEDDAIKIENEGNYYKILMQFKEAKEERQLNILISARNYRGDI